MSLWIDRILKEFTPGLARLWIAADPDDVLLDERVLLVLRERGFELLPFDDSVLFRAEYEGRYREPWDLGEDGPSMALILQLRGASRAEIPWDYASRGRWVHLSLAELFPKLSYTVVRQIGPEHYDALFSAQERHATQRLGESATKEFILIHVFKISPHIISRPEDLWRELLGLHYRNAVLPSVLGAYAAQILGGIPAFTALPISEMFCSKATVLRIVQDAWRRYVSHLSSGGARVRERPSPSFYEPVSVPFEDPGVRMVIDSMFVDGLLHPLVFAGDLPVMPDRAKVGVAQDPSARRNSVHAGIGNLQKALPDIDSSYRDWMELARKTGELLARFHTLDAASASELHSAVDALRIDVDDRLRQWLGRHYADLPSLPVSKGPVMVHHVPRFLSLRRGAGEDKIALIVFDGLAIDQWVQIRAALSAQAPSMTFEEAACFGWLPTLTSVSRQALFSGLKPREFAETIDSTTAEPGQWLRFWQGHGLRQAEVFFRKGVKRNEQLGELELALSDPSLKVAGIVVDTVDEFVHGAVLGKRGIAAQIANWCESGFVNRILTLLATHGFQVYLTSDHGNVDAVGQGRPKEGVAAESRGERVRIYRSETLVVESALSHPTSYRLEISGLPANYLPLFAGERTAFIPQGEQAVVHGGVSLEELLVPFIKVVGVNSTA